MVVVQAMHLKKYIHENILSPCTTATVMNSITELKQAILFSEGAFVHAIYYLADAFSIIPNNDSLFCTP